MSGFVVDRFGPRPALFAGLGLLGMAAIGFATSTHYLTLLVFAAVAGVGNGVFHPVDYTILNRKVSAARLGHAYSVHGITGSLGWALAPAMLVPLAAAFGWRVALLAAAGLIFTVLAIVFWRRRVLELPPAPHVAQHASQPAESAFGFLRIPAVWMCFAFFFFYAAVLSVIQTFATSSATHLTNVPATLAAMCLTAYMVASAGGMVVGGFLVAEYLARGTHCRHGLRRGGDVRARPRAHPGARRAGRRALRGHGFASGIAGPSRDMLVKRSTPENATGPSMAWCTHGFWTSPGGDAADLQALMDHGQYRGPWFGLALLQGVLIASAFNVRRVRRTLRRHRPWQKALGTGRRARRPDHAAGAARCRCPGSRAPSRCHRSRSGRSPLR